MVFHISNLYDASMYKYKIINLLLKNRDFITVINPVSDSKCEYLDDIEILLGGEWIYDGVKCVESGQVFDYNFVEDTVIKEKTFVFVETDIDNVSKNLFTNFNLYVCIFSTKGQIRITDKTTPTVNQIKDMGYYVGTYANRIDILCDIVDRILNGTNKIKGIGEVQPADRGYCTIYYPNNKFYGKCLKYKIMNYNEDDFCEN